MRGKGRGVLFSVFCKMSKKASSVRNELECQTSLSQRLQQSPPPVIVCFRAYSPSVSISQHSHRECGLAGAGAAASVGPGRLASATGIWNVLAVPALKTETGSVSTVAGRMAQCGITLPPDDSCCSCVGQPVSAFGTCRTRLTGDGWALVARSGGWVGGASSVVGSSGYVGQEILETSATSSDPDSARIYNIQGMASGLLWLPRVDTLHLLVECSMASASKLWRVATALL